MKEIFCDKWGEGFMDSIDICVFKGGPDQLQERSLRKSIVDLAQSLSALPTPPVINVAFFTGLAVYLWSLLQGVCTARQGTGVPH